MAKTTIATSPFYIQWHATGSAGGQWNGSQTSTNDKFSALDQWSLTPKKNYELTFSTKQGEGNVYTVYATIIDAAAKKTYGALFTTSKAAPLSITPMGQLRLQSGRLISGDPKIHIKMGKPNSIALTWSGEKWSPGGDQSMSVDGESQVTVNVRDQTASSATPHEVAAYLGDINSGVVLAQETISDPSQFVPLVVPVPAGTTQFTINLFVDVGDTLIQIS